MTYFFRENIEVFAQRSLFFRSKVRNGLLQSEETGKPRQQLVGSKGLAPRARFELATLRLTAAGENH